MNRVDFFIDGFNLYHSVLDISKQEKNATTKWLDIASLCKSYLYQLGPNSELRKIFYFTAIPYYLEAKNPNKIKRHKLYLHCLKKTGLVVRRGNFTERKYQCNGCDDRKRTLIRHEEKETDVAIAVKVLEVLKNDECDTIVLVTGDKDLIPAVVTSKKMYPDKRLFMIFPYNRRSPALAKAADGSFKISAKAILKHQFPNPMVLKDGTKIYKPKTW